jgi:gluconolactonase
MFYSSLVFYQTGQGIDSLKVVQPGAILQLVSKQFKFTEGPTVDKKGNIYFTDQPNDKIWKYDTKGNLTVFMDKTGRSNGLHFDNKGNLLACADEKNELWAIDAKKQHQVLLASFQGQKFNGPNDMWVDLQGGIYFTDPYYQRDWWERKKPDLDGQKVYYLPPGKTEALIVESDLKQPNGIVGTPDGKFLYVADISDNKTYKYAVGENGALLHRQLFVAQGSDGMTLDEQGNLYLTGKGVTIYDPQGQKIGNISVPANWTANVCFGGKKRQTLFITASEGVYTLQMRVKGVE